VKGEELSYTVYFENKATATAPAQEIFINDDLDAHLDWDTFKLGNVSFGKYIVEDLSGLQSGKTRVTLDNTLAVDIEAHRFAGSGLVKWTFRTVDVETGDLPEDALAGFLPPEKDCNGCGQGYVMFTIRVQKDAVSGTQIKNKATIIFDTEASITTNEVLHTVTDDPPAAGSVQPGIASGTKDVKAGTVLSWSSAQYATAYDLYLWESWTVKPSAPTAEDLTSAFYDPASELKYDTGYKWRIVAKNVMGTSASPEWNFTTGAYPYYLTNAILLLQAMTGTDVGDLSFIADINDDGLLGMPEVIFSFQKVAAEADR
jgi:hypothetical protein